MDRGSAHVRCLCILHVFLIRFCSERSAYEATVVHGVTQNTNSFCGVASAVMILNSLQVDAPIDEDHGFPYFNQANFFSKEVEDVVPATQVLAQGFTLDQLGRALQTWEYGGMHLHLYRSYKTIPTHGKSQRMMTKMTNQTTELSSLKMLSMLLK